MKKNGFIPLIIILVIAILGVVGYVSYKNPSKPQPAASPNTPQEVIKDAALIAIVRSKLSLSNKATVEVTIDEGNYAYGNAGELNGAGFYWAAAKENNIWSYVMSGNGIPNCKDVEIFLVGTFAGKFNQCYDNSKLVDRTIVIIPNIIDQWAPKVKWEKSEPKTYQGSLSGVLRTGTILNPDESGNPYNLNDLLNDADKKLSALGWELLLPTGASGPFTSLSKYSKDINGVSKILTIFIENSDYTRSPLDQKCPCMNIIEVFQEQ